MCSGGVLVGFWWGSAGFRWVLVGSGWFWWVLVDSEGVPVELMDGHPSMCWYDDRHVHLLDVIR